MLEGGRSVTCAPSRGASPSLAPPLRSRGYRKKKKKGLTEISTELRNLSEKARRGSLSLDDISGGTFTITNLGSYGVVAFTPIINPPQSAILDAGKITPRPTVENDGKMVIKPMMTLSLTFDDRVMDGHTAARFLRSLQEAIESPSSPTR